MDTKHAAHVLLDAEMCGRYGLEGESFTTTINYLSQYIEGYFKENKKEVSPEFQTLKNAMSDMAKWEESLDALRALKQTETNTLQSMLQALIEKATTSIDRLKEDEYILLPGGWLGINSGHAMVYRFKKTKQGILFSIYNSGAGLDHHEQTSLTSGEVFYPVRSFLIPPGVQTSEMNILMHHLIDPQIPALDTKPDADKLYNNIERSMIFLDASRHACNISQNLAL